MSSAAAEPSPLHEHDWRLVSVEGDGHVEVREFLCVGCPAVRIDDA